MKKHLAIAVAFSFTMASCATRWEGAASENFPGKNFDVQVAWLKVSDKQFDISSNAKGILCCMIPADDLRLSIMGNGKAKAKELCGDDQVDYESEAYDAQTRNYSARISCAAPK